MKLFVLSLLLGISQQMQAQGRQQNDPSVFISVELCEKEYDGFSITTGYYTIDNNINNRQSSAYISDTPSPDEYIYFARHQPSYYFLVRRQREVIRMIVLQQRVAGDRSRFSYQIINPATGQRAEVPSTLSGELTALRAKELMVGHTDPAGYTTQEATASLCFFNNSSYPVLPLEAVLQEVTELAHRLTSKDQSQREELKEYIRAETIGGKLDFRVALSKEPQQYFSRHGISYDKNDFSVLLWGGAVRMLGLHSVDSAVVLWEEIQQRRLTNSESKALRKGFAEQAQSEHGSLRK